MKNSAEKKGHGTSGASPPASLPMPVRAKPYRHQQEAFDFVCRKTEEYSMTMSCQLMTVHRRLRSDDPALSTI